MKKVLALLLAMMLLIGSCAALAEGVDYANLKEFVIDPSQIPRKSSTRRSTSPFPCAT